MSYDDMKSRVTGELKKVFRPELLNRIDEVIVFHKLDKAEIMQIVDLMLRRLREQMAEHKVTIELTDDAKELMVEKGYDPAMGARPLRRAIQRMIEDPLADFVLGAELMVGATLVVDRKDDSEEVEITIVPAAEGALEAEAEDDGKGKGNGKDKDKDKAEPEAEKVTVPPEPEDSPAEEVEESGDTPAVE
jgi:ATP-dependent Clp protease ATP-binding subunit ClpC